MQQSSKYVFDHIRKYRFTFWGVIFIGLLNSLVSFLLPVSIGEFFTLFFKTGSSKGKLLDWLGIELSTINQFFLLFTLLLFLRAILSYIEYYGTFRQGELFVKYLREDVFSAQIGWSAASMLDQSYGKYLLRYSNDLKSIQLYLTNGYMEGIKSVLFLITGLLVMMNIQWQITLLLVVMLIVVMVLVYLLARWQTGFIIRSRSARSSLLAYVARQFARFRKVKERQEEDVTMASFHEKSNHLFQANMKYNVSESLLLAVIPVLIFGVIGVLLWRMVFLQGSISASDGLMMVLILLMMEGRIRRILKVPTYLNKGKISLQKIHKMYDEPTPRVKPEGKAMER